MKAQKLAAINDMTSPLFRIMSVHNENEPNRRQIDNDICAFHIGNGYILSVAHVLKGELTIFRSMTEANYQATIMPHLNDAEILQFNGWYILDNATNKRYLMDTMDNINFSMRNDMLKFASSGLSRNWKMRQELRSPRYTSRWEELREVG